MKHTIFNILGVCLLCLVAVDSCKKTELDTPGKEFDLKLNATVSSSEGLSTKATLLDSDSSIPDNKFKLYGWENDTYWIQGVEATYTSGAWTLPSTYCMGATKSYSYLAYANLPSDGASISMPSVKDEDATLTVTDIKSAQNDILLGKYAVSSPSSGDVDIDFSHPFASVRFKLGNVEEETVTALSLSGVYVSGKTTYSQSSDNFTWTDFGNANATLSATGLSKSVGDTIATFVVIPQDLSSKNAVITVTYQSGNKIAKLLSSDSWDAGYTTTYTIDKIGEIDVEISGTNVTNSGSSPIYVRAAITGAWYDASGNVVAPWLISDGVFTGLPGEGWSKAESSDFYYFTDKLENGDSASSLFASFSAPTAPVEGATLKLDVLVQAIPYNVNKSCQEAFAAL